MDRRLWSSSANSAGRPESAGGASAIGRDHWPNCYSAMLAGAGIRGGQVYGRSDRQSAYVMDRPVGPKTSPRPYSMLSRSRPRRRSTPMDSRSGPARPADLELILNRCALPPLPIENLDVFTFPSSGRSCPN